MSLPLSSSRKKLLLTQSLCVAYFFLLQAQQNCLAEWVLPKEIRTSQSAEGNEQSTPNQWFCFRKQFKLDEIPESVPARIACDSKYWLWINGKIVVREGQLKRGPTPTGTYVDIVELKDHLQAGTNTVALLLWYFGKDGFSHNSSGLPGLLFEAENIQLESDASWQAISHPAFGNTEQPQPNYRLPESNVHFDARTDIPNWQSGVFDDSQWPIVKLASASQRKAWGELTTRPIPHWRDSDLLTYLKQSETEQESGDRVIVAKLPYNAQVTPYLKVKASAGQTISIRTDNYRGGSEYNVRTDYVTCDGEQEFESLIWMNGHDVHYSIPDEVEVIEFKYRESGYDTNFAGSFECDDEFLNRLWKKAQRTLYVNMRDTYFDCPGRERAQWWGDVTLLLTESFYALDRRADLLSRKGILELAAWQRGDGTLFSPVPAGNWSNELPMQMLASIGRYGFWTYYHHTGDRATIECVYPNVKRYVLEVWQLGDDGLVVPRKGGWTWGDWGEHKDLPLLYNGWYYLALDGLHSMAELVGDEPTRKLVELRMVSIRENFDKRFWRGHEYRSPAYKGLTDDRGQALAVVAGLAKPARYEDIRKNLAGSQHASPYMEKYVLEALYEMGYANDALARMKRRYQPMVDSPLTTLWEGWGIGEAGFGGGSYNHGWSGGPLILLSQFAAGVSPLQPGYQRFQVKPVLGTLETISARVHSAAGEIAVYAHQIGSTFELEVDVPENSVAEVLLPRPFMRNLQVNENRLLVNTKPTLALNGVRLVSNQNERKAIELQPGRWKLVATSEEQ